MTAGGGNHRNLGLYGGSAYNDPSAPRFMRVYSKALVFALALGMASALATDVDDDPDQSPEMTEPAANGATPEVEARPPAAPTADESRTAPTPARPADDRFVPTDRLRYDQEVDFPADI
jgi:hypothetical protein